MDYANFLTRIQQSLQNNLDASKLTNSPKAFKEEIRLYGVKVADLHKISKSYFKEIAPESKSRIFELCETLLRTGYYEDAYIACDWAAYLHKRLEPADLDVFERWLNQYVSNWAICDTLCNHAVGDLLILYPALAPRLKTWTASNVRWLRRGAAVSLIIPARKGLFLGLILQIADLLLIDQDDLVQKGYGWMLKAASQAHRQAVFDYVMFKRQTMPRTALRYAIEKMPPELKRQAMQK